MVALIVIYHNAGISSFDAENDLTIRIMFLAIVDPHNYSLEH